LKSYKIFLLDVKPHTFTIFKWLIYRLKKTKARISLIVPSALYTDTATINPLVGRIYTYLDSVESGGLEDIVRTFTLERKTCNAIAVTGSWLDILESREGILCADELGEKEDTGFKIIKSVIDINAELVEKEITNIINLFKDSSNEIPIEKDSITELNVVSPSIPDKNPTIYVISTEGVLNTAPGAGMGNLGMNNITMLLRAAGKYGYDVVLAPEQTIQTMKPGPEDRVIGFTMNNIFRGGYTTVGQGFELRNLLTMSTFQTKTRPIVVTSLHVSEASIYGKPTRIEIASLNGITASAFNPAGLRYLKGIGLNTTQNTWPIPIDPATRKSFPRNVTKETDLKILFQFDAQHRKNGEYILFMILDAVNSVLMKGEKLSIEIVAKATAPHSIVSPIVCKTLVESIGLKWPEPFSGVKINYEGRTSNEEWAKTIASTDIGIFLSTEEGLHMFVAECWLEGVHCVVPEPNVYPKYSDLGRGIITVPVNEVPSGGTGLYNDLFKTTTYFPKYNESVKAIEYAILNLRKEKPRTPIDNQVITTTCETYVELLGLKTNKESTTKEAVTVTVFDERYKAWLIIENQ